MNRLNQINTVKALVKAIMAVSCILVATACDVSAETEMQAGSAAVVNPAVRWQAQTFLSLDGQWSFRADPHKEGEKQQWFQPDVAWPDGQQLQVPGCWEAQGIGKSDEYSLLVKTRANYVAAGMKTGYAGAAWYRKEVMIPENWAGRQIWLKFGGVDAQAWAYVNGTLIAHLGGADQTCGTFKYGITSLLTPGKPAVIVVKVRNDVPSTKGGRVVARRYGGITRSVELEATPDVLIDYADVLPDVDKQTARVNVLLRNAAPGASAESDYELSAVVRDPRGTIVGRIDNRDGTFADKTKAVTLDVPLSPCQLWTPDTPALHTVEITLSQGGKVTHGWTERFGMVNWSAKGSDIFMNGKKWFVRGIGFDAHWPLSISYPTDRERLRKVIARVKSFGFNHIRTWAHTPTPEFCEVAAEEGVSLTVEMPYYHGKLNSRQGRHAQKLPNDLAQPIAQQNELLTHFRRYASVFTFSGGNEGRLPMEDKLVPELLKSAKTIAPGKLWTYNTGHIFNTPSVSDYKADYYIRRGGAGRHIPNFPHVLHEYFNAGYPGYDPRLEFQYKNGLLPPIPLAAYRTYTDELGMPWPWVEATLKAGEQMLSYYQKVAIENARIVTGPSVDGYHLWGSINGDTHFFALTNAGLLTPFFEYRNSTPDYFRPFNRSEVLLCKVTQKGQPYQNSIKHAHGRGGKPKTQVFPEQVIFTSGDNLNIEFWLSNFAEASCSGDLDWEIRDGSKVLTRGTAEACSAAQGELKALHKLDWTVPKLTEATRLTVACSLRGTDVTNSWEIWAFPSLAQSTLTFDGVVATPSVYDKLKPRFPKLKEWSDDASFELLLTEEASSANVACQRGQRVLLLGSEDFMTVDTTVHGGEWGPNTQMGTAIADHPAFNGFPNKAFVDPLFSRLLTKGIPMNPAFKDIDPIMLGMGRLPGGNAKLPGFLLYAFEARVENGRLLATSMDLLSEHAEAACLLHSFIDYALSEKFRPTSDFALTAAMALRYNGVEKIVQCVDATEYELFLGSHNVSTARSQQPNKPLIWETKPAPKLKPGESWDVIFPIGMETEDQRAVTFLLQVNDTRALEIPFTLESAQNKSPDGIIASYKVVESAVNVTHAKVNREIEMATLTGKKSTIRNSSGVMTITVPDNLIKAGNPLTLKAMVKPSEGQGWFGVIE